MPKKLQYVSVSLMRNEKCVEFYGRHSLTKNMICAGHEKNFCSGDSGKAAVNRCKWLILKLTKKLSEFFNCKALKSLI